jgi:hypothetical protein
MPFELLQVTAAYSNAVLVAIMPHIPTKTDISPVASLYAVFKSKSGKTQEGGLYAPISDSH